MNDMITAGLIFATGLGLGCYAGMQSGSRAGKESGAQSAVHPGLQRASADQSAAAVARGPRRKHDREARAAAEASQRVQAAVRRIQRRSIPELDKLVEEISLGDIGPVLEGILAQPGIDLNDSFLEESVDKLAVHWGRENFEGAMAWAASCVNEGLAQAVKSMLLVGLADSDPDRALALYLAEIAQDKQFGSNVVTFMMERKAQEGPAALLELMAKLKDGDPSTEGYFVKFPAGFDFAALLDGIRQGESSGQQLAAPSGILDAWTQNNPDSAHDWWVRNGRLRSEQWGAILSRLDYTIGSGGAAEWAAARWTAADSEVRRKMALELNPWPDGPLFTGRVTDILNALPDDGSKQEFIGDVIRSHGGDLHGQGKLVALLSKLPTQEQRSDVLRGMLQSGRFDPKQLTDATLQSWQITRDELEQAED